MWYVYEKVVPDKADNSSISFEEESIEGLEWWNSEASKNSFAPISGNSYVFDLIVSEPALLISNRISKLLEWYKDYEVTINCSSVKYPI